MATDNLVLELKRLACRRSDYGVDPETDPSPVIEWRAAVEIERLAAEVKAWRKRFPMGVYDPYGESIELTERPT